MNKGILTVLSDENIVLGLPIGIRWNQYSVDEMQAIKDSVLVWVKYGGLLILEFPVDVIDMRQKDGQKSDLITYAPYEFVPIKWEMDLPDEYSQR